MQVKLEVKYEEYLILINIYLMSSSAKRVQNIVPFRTSAVFCKNCGMMLKMESNKGTADCRFCNHVTNIAGIFLHLSY